MKPASILSCLLLLGLVGCTDIDPAILAEHDRTACEELGFERDSDSWKLCLLLQDQNRRLAYIENRIGFIELDVDRYGYLHRPVIIRRD